MPRVAEARTSTRKKPRSEDEARATRTSLYQEITGKIVVQLEAGCVPWVQPWDVTTSATLGLPKNAATGRTYSGINVLLLWGAVIERGYPRQAWLTFRQALGLGGSVSKGERGTTVVFADRFTPEEERNRARRDGDEPRGIHFLKRFTVFNTEQCDGLAGRCRRSAGTGSREPDPASSRGTHPRQLR